MNGTALGKETVVAVIGAGTMGAGIAQVAATAGHPVLLYDAAPGAAEAGLARMRQGLEGQVARGKLEPAAMEALLARITVAGDLAALAPAGLVIEAVVEKLEVKQAIFSQLEQILPAQAILASNTSSISITRIARGLARPERVVGMHFFNPAPVMKLVEVVSGLATDPEVAAQIHATATGWGKVAVQAKSTPGFIVNRIARAYYSEPLRLTEEGACDPASLDALFTGAGFRMGPFALMDLIGLDVNVAVSTSVFEAFFYEPRFRPSLLQHEMVAAGWLGRKTGRGFYSYAPGAEQPQPRLMPVPEGAEALPGFDLSGFDLASFDLAAGDGAMGGGASADPASSAGATSAGAGLGGTSLDRTSLDRASLGGGLDRAGVDGANPARIGRALVALSDGRRAAERERETGRPVILHDLPTLRGGAIGYTLSPGVSEAEEAQWLASLAALGHGAIRLPDLHGLVVLRTVAMIANEGFEALLQGVAAERDIDLAMQFGVNYPKGPMAWAREIGLARVCSVLRALGAATGDMRYRPSLALQRALD